MSDNGTDLGSGRFAPIRVPSAYEMVAESIEREILSGRLRPGDEIGTEASLVRQFGVNRSTVREGIRMLEQNGLVARAAGRRLIVSTPHYRNLSSRMSRALVLSEVTFSELFAAAIVLETGAAEAAAQGATEADIARLEQNLANSRDVADDPARLAALDIAFHTLVAQAAHNRVLELSREPAALLFFPTVEMICRRVPEGPTRMLAAHERLIAAIRARDPVAARAWMRRHVEDWLKGFRRTGRDPDAPVEHALAAVAGVARAV